MDIRGRTSGLEDWGAGSSLFKKGGWRVCSNYKGITHPGKGCAGVMEKRLQLIVETQIHDSWFCPACGLGEGNRSCLSGCIATGCGPLYKGSESLVSIAGCELDLFSVRFGLHQGCNLSPILFILLIDRNSRFTQGAEDATPQLPQITEVFQIKFRTFNCLLKSKKYFKQ